MRQRSQIFYLYRDADTISYERMNDGNPNQIVFGWMFRPVLERRSISPGLRQLFAIVALPAIDDQGEDCASKLNTFVKTYWKEYDRKTMTSFGNSFNVNTAYYKNIEVKPTKDYQKNLEPWLASVSWRLVGQKSALISAEGNNFSPGHR